MAYSAPSNQTTGDLITQAIWNQNVVANIIAIYAGAMSIASQAAGEILYAGSTTQIARNGAWTFDGTSGVILSAGVTGGNGVFIRAKNTGTGTGDYGYLAIGNSGGDNRTALTQYSTGYTTGTIDRQDGTTLRANGTGGLTLVAADAGGALYFFTGGTASGNERMRLQQGLSVGSTTDPGTGFVSATGGFSMATWPTTASAANANVANAAAVKLSTSSLAFKQIDRYLAIEEARSLLMAMPPAFFYRSTVDEDQRLWLGFGAEHVAPKVPVMALYNPDGSPNYVTYDRLTALLTPVVQDHERRLQELESRH